MPEATAEKDINLLFVFLAIILASVVLPQPGGPQKIMENNLSPSIILLESSGRLGVPDQ